MSSPLPPRSLAHPLLRLSAPLLLLLLFLTACTASTRPTLKVALVAPFEGRYREVGYEVIYAVRLAVREVNAAGGIAGYGVELVALDDGGDPLSAATQARKASADPQVLAALGHWLEPTTQAAAPEYAAAQLPLLATTAGPLPAGAFRVWPTAATLLMAEPKGYFCPPPCESLEDLSWLQAQPPNLSAPLVGPPLWGLTQFPLLAGERAEGVLFVAPAPFPTESTDPSFADRYRAISNGVAPRFNAVLAYDATRLLFAAIEHDIQAHGQPTRAGVAQALREVQFAGLSGSLAFDGEHDWVGATAWVYQWENGTAVPGR